MNGGVIKQNTHYIYELLHRCKMSFGKASPVFLICEPSDDGSGAERINSDVLFLPRIFGNALSEAKDPVFSCGIDGYCRRWI